MCILYIDYAVFLPDKSFEYETCKLTFVFMYTVLQTLSLLLGAMVDVFGKNSQPSVPAQASEIIDLIDFL